MLTESLTEVPLQNGVSSLESPDSRTKEGRTNDENIDIDEKLVEEVREMLRSDFEENGELYCESHYNEIMNQISSCTCWRYLVHSQQKPSDALELMKRSLEWRKENSVADLDCSLMAKELWHYSPLTMSGVDKLGHDVMYVIARNYRKADAIFKPLVRKLVLNLLANWEKAHHEDFGQLTIVFDTTDSGLRNIDVEFTTWLAGLCKLMPGRFYAIYVIGIPFIVRPVVRLIISLLPTSLSSLVHCGTYEQLIKPNITQQNLPSEVGGNELCQLAPKEVPWMADLPAYADTALLKAMEASVGYAVSQKTRDRRRALQLEYESKNKS